MRICSRNNNIQCESKNDSACRICQVEVSNGETMKTAYKKFLKVQKRKRIDRVAIKPFKLESVDRCYICGDRLKTREKKYKSAFKFKGSDGDVLGTVETYVCFGCIEKLTGLRPDQQKQKGCREEI